MKNRIFVLSVMFLQAFLIISCSHSKKHTKKIEPNKGIETESITLDGTLNDWEESPFISSLSAPWKEGQTDETYFNYRVEKDQFLFYFKTIDSSITVVPFEKELSVAEGDRVELFFSPTKDLSKNYYCIEMSPDGHILDYKANYYRKFEEEWDFKTAKVISKYTDNGYLVEGKIDLKELEQLGIGDTFYLGVFKADYKDKENVTWYSWIKPDSSEPDFHIPSAFRVFTIFSTNEK